MTTRILVFIFFLFSSFSISFAECSVNEAKDHLTFNADRISKMQPGCNTTCTIKTKKSETGEEETEIACANTLANSLDARCVPTSSFIVSDEKAPSILSCDGDKK